jgi:hypothetical protein
MAWHSKVRGREGDDAVAQQGYETREQAERIVQAVDPSGQVLEVVEMPGEGKTYDEVEEAGIIRRGQQLVQVYRLSIALSN